MSSRPDCLFEIHQLWQSGFSRVYSNCCCSRSFEPEIIEIDLSSHKMYRNNSEFLRVYDNFKCLCKKVWKLIESTMYVYVSSLFLNGREHMWHKVSLMGYLMRFEPTLVCCLNVFSWFRWVLYRSYHFFLECTYFSLLYPSLIFDMFIIVYVSVHASGWFWVSLTVIFSVCVCVCVLGIFVCAAIYIYNFLPSLYMGII